MRFLFYLLYTYVLHIYGYNIFARIPFFGRKSISPLARHLGRFDFLMTTSSLVDQIGWEEKVMSYLIFVIFFIQAKFLENKIYTEKTCKLRQNTQ